MTAAFWDEQRRRAAGRYRRAKAFEAKYTRLAEHYKAPALHWRRRANTVHRYAAGCPTEGLQREDCRKQARRCARLATF